MSRLSKSYHFFEKKVKFIKNSFKIHKNCIVGVKKLSLLLKYVKIICKRQKNYDASIKIVPGFKKHIKFI